MLEKKNCDGEKKLWNYIAKKSKSVEIKMNPVDRRHTGSYYTSLELTDVMMKELVFQILKDKNHLCDMKFLEPCVGTGNFVFSYLKEVKNLGYDKDVVTKIINNIYVCDINELALDTYKTILIELCKEFFDISLSDDYFLTHVGKTLLIDISSDDITFNSISDVFPSEVVGDGFDIVVTNPPYRNLKAERSQYKNQVDYENVKLKFSKLSKLLKSHFTLSTYGVLNIYKVFVEDIISNYSANTGYISLLIPSSILSDKTCEKIRTYLLKNTNIYSIKAIPEENRFIDACQSLCAMFLKKGGKTKYINVTKNYCQDPTQVTKIDAKDINDSINGNSIVAIDEHEYKLLKQMKNYPTVKDIPFIKNFRGELDLTVNKEFITKEKTDYPLLRGRHIGYYFLSEQKELEYVHEDFANLTNKEYYIHRPRIACQQIANMSKERRVIFSYVDENYILGNSCNFISVLPNEFNIDIYMILGLFNTKIINWFFKLTSSNNHINNYEIDSFPVPISSSCLKNIGLLTKKYLVSHDEALLDKIEELALKSYQIDSNIDIEMNHEFNTLVEFYYKDLKEIVPQITKDLADDLINNASLNTVMLELGINVNKFEEKIIKGITEKYKKISKNQILNHLTFKLSDLDLEMIKNVPPGGNWKNIPLEVVNKSKRLKKITQTGGRTTLYGRIDYNKPSYTITTYFNRPGNGTYVHPVHNRVLSVREAARFQTFKDDYYFYGNKTQILKQIGNAVPTILAYQIAEKIKKVTGCTKSLDLFCGAGGMTAGFKEAGINSVLSTDIEESALLTLKINNPEIPVLCGDITDDKVKDKICQIAVEKGVEIICGGPPCQGFSMAGFRLEDDPRNQLFRDFVDIVEQIRPKVIVFENVEGLLSYQNGKTYNELHQLFSSLGYKTEGRLLLATNYAVPQKRKRVIVICVKKDLLFDPADLFPAPITSEESMQITAGETISDLEDIPCNENASYKEKTESNILQLLKGKMSYSDYIKTIKASCES